MSESVNMDKHTKCGAEWARHHCPAAYDKLHTDLTRLLELNCTLSEENETLWKIVRILDARRPV